MSAIEELLEVMARLRDPAEGCAWDVQQNFSSISPYTIEEAYEVADAIERNDMADLCDELGDLLLQVVFHARMAEELGEFAFADVAKSIVDKMVRRHPHVFAPDDPLVSEENRSIQGEKPTFSSTDELKSAWEEQKSRERANKSGAGSAVSALDGVAMNLPALMRAAKIQKRAARVGFDWTTLAPVVAKVDEELIEVNEAIESGDANAIEDEVGDLLFAVVNLARHVKVDPEVALRQSTAKFSSRFREVETLARQRSIVMSSEPLAVLDELWDEVKDRQMAQPRLNL